MHFSEWDLLWRLGLALVLSTIIGVEREVRQKNAGMRTYALVGTGAALFMLVSMYGFAGVLQSKLVVLDPSRVAAGVVSGIGFIGGGLIFVRRDSVRGLTTAAIVWLTTAVGMACGAGLPILAIVVTGFHFIVVFAFPYVVERLPRSRWTPSPLEVSYEDGRGILRDVLVVCTQNDFAVSRLCVQRLDSVSGMQEAGASTQTDAMANPDDPPSASVTDQDGYSAPPKRIVTVSLEVQGTRSVAKLAAKLVDIAGVIAVNAGDVNVPSD
jgi:putative Mg2+ transporter-C (MgtC) family protein